jgi:hypothetical protein
MSILRAVIYGLVITAGFIALGYFQPYGYVAAFLLGCVGGHLGAMFVIKCGEP